MSDNSKIIIGITISFFVILFGPYFLKKQLSTPSTIINKQSAIQNTNKYTNHLTNQNNPLTVSTNSKKPQKIKKIYLENDHIQVEIANNIITKCLSKKHFEKHCKHLYNILKQPIIINCNINKDIQTISNTPSINWSLDHLEKNKALFSYTKNNILYQIQYTLDELHQIQIETSIINNSKNAITASSQILMPFTEEETITSCQSNVLNDHTKQQEIISNIDWISKYSTYWVNAIHIPFQTNTPINQFIINKSNISTTSHTTIQPNADHKLTYNIISSPKSLPILNKYSHSLPLLDRTIEFGWLYIITKPILLILMYLYDITQDYGVSIITLTILIQLTTLYFNYKGYISLQKIKLLQPTINQINSQYANDAMTKSKKIFDLYAKENISIFSQIVPILIQIPIFYSIYKVIGFSVEIRGAQSLYFINDLSSYDTTNLLSFIPNAPISLGVLPILTGISFYLQNLTNPQSQSQNMEFMQYLPIIMIFIAQTTFPSGIMLYLITNNFLTSIRQFLMNRFIIVT